MMRVFDVETFMTWAHYTLWILLYPLSFLCEGTSPALPPLSHLYSCCRSPAAGQHPSLP